jgi:hypothetical protein
MPPRGLPSHRYHHHRQTTPFNNVDEESDSTDESNLPDSPESENKATLPLAKIPKPPGEAGRKNSGGFNLQEVLGWNDNKYKKFLVSHPSLWQFLLTKEKAMDRRRNNVETEPQQTIQQAEARSNPGSNPTGKSRVTMKGKITYVDARGPRSSRLLIDTK